MNNRFVNIIKKIRVVLLILITLFFTLSIGGVILYKYIPINNTPLMVIQWLNGNNASYINTKEWVPLENISAYVAMAAIVSEDLKFIVHRGFDWKSIESNFRYNNLLGRKNGGSTISQQTAKNVFLIPNKSWIRKLFETYFTFLIETFWSKKRILEVYLNVIEFGSGIYGINSASKYYFNKFPLSITIDEAALLITCLPNPRDRNPLNPTDNMNNRAERIKYLINNYPIGVDEIYEFLNGNKKD